MDAKPLISLGTMTTLGKVGMVRLIEGERYYFMVDRYGVVSMMPACAMEQLLQGEGNGTTPPSTVGTATDHGNAPACGR